MSVQTWLKSNADYSRKLVHSAAEGAQLGEEAFLRGEGLGPFLRVVAHDAVRPAAVGALVGFVTSLVEGRRHPVRTLAFGFMGGAIGFGASLAWKSRPLTISIVNGARKEVEKVRDEHWFEQNPIDYA